jgi:hypothetical protein
MGRYIDRAWVTTLPLTPIGIGHFYDGRAGMEPRIRELREDFALRKIPTASCAANVLFLEIVRLAYNLVTAFQRTCLDQSWQSLTLPKLRYKLFMLPGELTRPQNRPVLRLRPSPLTKDLPGKILAKVVKLNLSNADHRYYSTYHWRTTTLDAKMDDRCNNFPAGVHFWPIFNNNSPSSRRI